MTCRICLLTLFYSHFTGAADVPPQPAGLSPTALDRYVVARDESYRYHVDHTVTGDGFVTYVVDMTSQTWLTDAEVDEPEWRHAMTITRPEAIRSDIGFLMITGGSRTSPMPKAAPERDVTMARATGTVVATLYMVPNQPLVFVGDETRPRSEDAAIAYTWDKYLRTGDEKWPMRLPMTKAAVRAMDTVTDVLSQPANGAEKIARYVVAGGSKRGWTAWTTAAVDKRVVAVVPIVIDLLNVEESFKHHYEVYGRYAQAVQDYQDMRIMAWTGTPEYRELIRLVEPFEYRARLGLPKYIVNSAGDQFFLPDSWRFYWRELPGEKHLRYVPNSDHGLAGTDVFETIVAWYTGFVHGAPTPRYSWDVAGDGTITFFTLDEPLEVRLWRAHNAEARNFMKAAIGEAYTSRPIASVQPGRYVARISPPDSGFTAYFLEASYASGMGAPLKFTTGVTVVPDKVSHRWRPAPAEERARLPEHR